jgi:hypothetical protein
VSETKENYQTPLQTKQVGDALKQSRLSPRPMTLDMWLWLCNHDTWLWLWKHDMIIMQEM